MVQYLVEFGTAAKSAWKTSQARSQPPVKIDIPRSSSTSLKKLSARAFFEFIGGAKLMAKAADIPARRMLPKA